MSDTKVKPNEKPYIRITEQPQSITKFQHRKEIKKVETIKGVNSTEDKETYPTIELLNHKGSAIAVVSCVTKDPPHFPHPCSIIDKNGKNKEGVYCLRFCPHYPQLIFPDIIIQRVRKHRVLAALEERQRKKVDPFETGFDHRHFPDSMDLDCVRLCFQAFLEDKTDCSYTIPLTPVVSVPIYNAKDTSSALEIHYISHATASVAGGQAMCIVSSKLRSGDVQVRFFDLSGWEAYARTVSPHFHKRIAVIFESPKYVNQDIDEPVGTYVELIRPSDGMRSEAVPFQFIPWGAYDRESVRIKRPKNRESPRDLVLKHLEAESVPGANEYKMKEVQKIKDMQLHKIEYQQYRDSRYQHDKLYQYQWNEKFAQQRIQQSQYNIILQKKTKEEMVYQQEVEREVQEHLRNDRECRYHTGQGVLQHQQHCQNEQAEQQQQENATEVDNLPQCRFESKNHNYSRKKESPVKSDCSSTTSTLVNDNLVKQNNVPFLMQMQIVKNIHKATASN